MKKIVKLLAFLFLLLITIVACIRINEHSNPKKTYIVTFDSAGGTSIESQSVEAGKTAITPANPYRKDYVFLFWHLSGEATTYNFQSPVNSDITLIAKWEENGYPFYYYGAEKIFLKEEKDKIVVEFAKGAGKEQICALIEDSELQPFPNMNWDYYDPNFTLVNIFETKNNMIISEKIINSFKTNPMIISVSYVYQSRDDEERTRYGLMNEFFVQLNESTSYAQLQELAKKHSCIVGEESPYDYAKNTFTIYVSKTSELNAMQMANLFYETGFFKFAEPNFWFFNARGEWF